MKPGLQKPLRYYPPPPYPLSKTQLIRGEGHWIGRFHAMACDCEILVDAENRNLAKKILKLAAGEAWRIERKFSRYRKNNLIDQINHGKGKAIEVDEETAQLLDFAQQCYEMSEGMFDITSGVLRRIWKFDGSDAIPTQEQVAGLLPCVGWSQVSWCSPEICLPQGMEIDLGGIGKEYAVDRILRLLMERFDVGLLVNLGGDTAVGGERKGKTPWNIGIESINQAGVSNTVIQVKQGAVATSGDAQRFLLKEGKRYGHIINPKSGWPSENAPHSITVAANTCTEAGLLSTLAMLHGAQAESFLDAEEVRYWCLRDTGEDSPKTSKNIFI